MALAAITNYATLVDNISDFMARTDLEYAYDSWIQQAEKRLNSALKVPGMEASSTLTLDAAGTTTVPADYIEWVMARWAAQAPGTRKQRLRYVEANSPEFTYRHRPNGDPQFYTVSGGKVQVVPAVLGSLDLTYYRQIPALTSAAPTNWLITRAPHVYLSAVLSVGYAFQKDEANAAKWMQDSDNRLQMFIQESSSGKIGRRAERAAEIEADVIAAKAVS